MKATTTDNIEHLPISQFMKEGQSQGDRRILEVMEALFNSLPERDIQPTPDFVLADGTECRITKFSAPYENYQGDLVYGFDVKFDTGPLSHLEFAVKCSGWERSLVPSD